MTHGKTYRLHRLLAGALALALIVGLVPYTAPAAQAEANTGSWADGYLEKLVDWGVMRGDQAGNLNPEREITRAEYVSMINRAYGYNETAATPFTDVSGGAWYAEDIAIGYRAGYFTGTSETTASPEGTLTREQATVILGRNLMLREGMGESLDFTDSRELSEWSRGIVKSAAEDGVVKGYPDGSFQPLRNITRGEAASLLVNAIGTPLSQPGEYNLGSVPGNVTISSSGVTLRNTVIAGDLYVSGGVGLGYVTLENVTVLGKIVASGAGESNKGDSSVILRNVTAPRLVVDSPSNKMVTVRAEGDTKIGATSVRTPSYMEDTTEDDWGFTYIELDGEEGTALELAGNIKEVMALTPNASLTIAKGTAQIVTVDEMAAGTAVVIENGGEIKTLNLDVATRVTGAGDIENLFVNAAGSSTTMLPDKITIRPGLTANIAGEVMDNIIGTEASEAPRLLSGYPRIADLAPNTASALFRTNKRGTIYWAISSVTDGSVGEEDLINPPSYSSKVLRSGSVVASASNTDYTARITGLTSDGSYYLSAVLVDAHGQRSPVKVAAFTTPDNTVPNFANGYPVMTKITDTSGQVTVMTTKTCRLYYALLPTGAAAPTPDDFKADAVTGNLGFGTLDVTKNVTRTFTVNDRPLEELKAYDLYLWLTDIDGAQSSAVRRVNFTTVDRTPPVFLTEPTPNRLQPTSVGMLAALNEAGTIYWVAVPTGEEYPKPMAGQTEKPALSSDAAKLQVSSGMNALVNGKVNAQANRDVTINVGGLTAQTAYDVYYLAQDTAGNYSETVKMITIHTLDTEPPEVTQVFTRTNDEEGLNPLADTDVRLVFSEGIQDANGEILLDLYQTSIDNSKTEAERTAAKNTLIDLLRQDIQLWDGTKLPAAQVTERTAENEDDTELNWTIDYRYVKISMEGGKTIVSFENGKAINLRSGSEYYFQITNIADTSNNKNLIRPNPFKMDSFRTVFAQVNLDRTSESDIKVVKVGETDEQEDVTLHMSFQMFPLATERVDPSVYWDMLIWSDTMIDIKLYRREISDSNHPPAVWESLGEANIPVTDGTFRGVSMTKGFAEALGGTNRIPNYGLLNTLEEDKVYEYGIQVTSINGVTDETAWSREVNVQITLAAGGRNDLDNLASDVSPQNWTTATNDWGVSSIGLPDPFTLNKVFSDSKAPAFTGGYPSIDAGDTKATMTFMLDRPGTIYYAVTPVKYDKNTQKIEYSLITAKQGADGKNVNVLPDEVPEDGTQGESSFPTLSLPLYTTIVQPNFATPRIRYGNQAYNGNGQLEIKVDSLEPETLYYAYIVTKGTSTSSPFSKVYLLQFTTTEVLRPVITLDISNPNVNVTVDSDSVLDYILVATGKEDNKFLEKMTSYLKEDWKGDGSGNEDENEDGNEDENEFQEFIDKFGDITVLDAMSTDVMVGGKSTGTVFDLYASETAKNTYAGLIRNQSLSPSVVVMKGQDNFAADQPMTSVECTGMVGSTWYTFLTVGRSNMGSGDAFRAIRPVFLQDTEPPVVFKCTFVPDYYPTSPTGGAAGELTVTFNEDLYYKQQEGNNQTITPLEASTKLPATTGYVLAASVVKPGTGITMIKGEKGKTCYILKFKMTGAKAGTEINFDGNICDKGGNSRSSTPLILTLTYEPVTDANNNVVYRPYFTITPEWDATQK